jgi:hypothetical protein
MALALGVPLGVPPPLTHPAEALASALPLLGVSEALVVAGGAVAETSGEALVEGLVEALADGVALGMESVGEEGKDGRWQRGAAWVNVGVALAVGVPLLALGLRVALEQSGGRGRDRGRVAGAGNGPSTGESAGAWH